MTCAPDAKSEKLERERGSERARERESERALKVTGDSGSAPASLCYPWQALPCPLAPRRASVQWVLHSQRLQSITSFNNNTAFEKLVGSTPALVTTYFIMCDGLSIYTVAHWLTFTSGNSTDTKNIVSLK